jgi:hypothetical protein
VKAEDREYKMSESFSIPHQLRYPHEQDYSHYSTPAFQASIRAVALASVIDR